MREHTEGLLSRLEVTQIPVGDGERPEGAGWQGAPGQSEFVTYLVLSSIDRQRQGPDASIGDRNTAPLLRFQVMSVGATTRAAETASDLACAQLLNHQPLDIPGWSTVKLTHELTLPADRDEAVNPPLFYVIDRYRLDTQKET